MSDVRTVLVPEGLHGSRVDAAVARLFGLSRTKAADLAGTGRIRSTGRRSSSRPRSPPGRCSRWNCRAPRLTVDRGHRRTGAGDADRPRRLRHRRRGQTCRVAAHPSAGWSGPTVVGGLATTGYRIATSGASERQGIVSRLDVGTSGLMVVCKSERAYSLLKRAFKERRVEKIYHTLVQGLPDPLAGTIDAPIGRHPGHDYKFAVMDSGKPAITHYELIEAYRRASLLRVRLETGRTHQIRVHMSAIRHPCVGDPLYGADPTLAQRLGLDRQWLHAMGLGFEHPGSGEWVTFESTYPPDLARALERLEAR